MDTLANQTCPGRKSPKVTAELISDPTIAYVGLMPSEVLGAHKQKWRHLLGEAVDFRPVRFDDDPRLVAGSRSAEYLLRECEPFSEVPATRVLMTGGNWELTDPKDPLNADQLPFSGIPFIGGMDSVMDWADENAEQAFYVCLSAHRYVARLAGRDYRQKGDKKTIGVFEHGIVAPQHPLMTGLESTKTLYAPHARWCNLPSNVLEDCGIQVLVEGEAGWLLAAQEKRTAAGKKAFVILSNGHLEYNPLDLSKECLRDRERGLKVDIPRGYEDPQNLPPSTWKEPRAIIFDNVRHLNKLVA